MHSSPKLRHEATEDDYRPNLHFYAGYTLPPNNRSDQDKDDEEERPAKLRKDDRNVSLKPHTQSLMGGD